jgi:hypothetical protein
VSDLLKNTVWHYGNAALSSLQRLQFKACRLQQMTSGYMNMRWIVTDSLLHLTGIGERKELAWQAAATSSRQYRLEVQRQPM